MSVTRELKDDGTFCLTDDFDPQDSSNGESTLSEDGKTITLSNFEMTDEEKRQVATMGSNFIEPQILTVSEDGKMLTYFEDLLGIRMKMYFTRN